ncbi:FAD:protein FMN transferase [Pedobacter sp.]|uniref:FAD:protein FMN transferase n=1 Tax=Pedobacter sp. TaxID=1411316 RepID=UPI003D7FAD6A
MFKIILMLALWLPSVFYQKPEIKTFHINGYAQGTTYQIAYYASQPLVAKEEVDILLKKLDHSLSIYVPHSLINQFNNSSRGVLMDPYLHEVVLKSIEIYKKTDGNFDFTVYPLVQAWGFGTSKINQLPDAATIQKCLKCVGSDKILIKQDSLIKTDPCVKIDVNGIAQGYSVDVVAKYLDRKQIKTYLVEIGGELVVKGVKPTGEPMQIGIESPSDSPFDSQSFQRIVQLKAGAITTSGNYRKYISSGTQKYAHLIDPKTGYPLQNQMISATVIANDAITADGYDNALMALDVVSALKLVKAHPSMEAYLIYKKADGSIADTASVGFYKLLLPKDGN